MSTIIKSSPTLVGVAKEGHKKFWVKHIYQDGDKFYTGSESWSETKDGESKHLIATPSYCSPKNVGRSNETTSKEQAELEFAADIKLKLDKGYKDSTGQYGKGTSDEKGYYMPMLAHKYKDRFKALKWPCIVQPKLDGVRALYESSRGFWTRGGKPFHEEVVAHFRMSVTDEFFPEDIVLDGEFMMPQGFSFQDTVAHCKKVRPNTGWLLEYHVFDIIFLKEPNMSCEARLDALASYCHVLAHNYPDIKIVLVPTFVCDNEKEMFKFQEQFVLQGYEGTMVRNRDAAYLIGNRSPDLLKYKDFIDEEFTIIGVKDGDGKFEGAAVFIVQVTKDIVCEVTPRGTMEQRRHWFSNFQTECLGRQLTVRFQERTDDGSLRFPIGISIRDEVQG